MVGTLPRGSNSMPDARRANIVSFGPFKLDLKAGELHRSGTKIPLQEQPFLVLRMLVENHGEVVTREEIRRKLWPNDTLVEFDHSINAAIKKLRLALGDSAGNPCYVETVARRGYRFLVTVEWVEAPQHAHGAEVRSGNQTPASAQRNLIGRRVSHYRVLEVLGGGGMGLVYSAEDIKLGRRVALKFLPEELAGDPLALGRFEREARAASALEHPNICPVYEFGEHDGQPFIVMQLLRGQTLRERIEEGIPGGSPFKIDELVDLAIQIAEGLDAAHQKSIIHRDIKPANIFITSRGEAKILDFGLAKLVEGVDQTDDCGTSDNHGIPVQELPPIPSANLTRTGATMGTASYMSPEQVCGENLDARTDLFSFGVVLYEMATGKQAFPAQTVAQVHEAILHRTPAPARKCSSELPLELEGIIHRALDKDRETRYQSAADMAHELKRLKFHTKAEPSSPVAVLSHHEPPVSTHQSLTFRWEVVVAAVFALLLVAAAVFWLIKPNPHSILELKQRQLTTSSSEAEVLASAISPDGRYLAYADPLGIHLKLIQTGETRTIPQPESLKGSQMEWDPHVWLRDGTGFLAAASITGQRPSIWTVPLMGGPPRRLRDDARLWDTSPDGSFVAFTTNEGKVGDREVWLMSPEGEQLRKAWECDENSRVENVRWSPDSKRLAYYKVHQAASRLEVSLESRDLTGSPPTTILSGTAAESEDFYWLPDGRMIYSSVEPDSNRNSCNLWQMRVDTRTGQPREAPKRLTNWAGFCMANMSVTSDGKRLAFSRGSVQDSVYVADLEAGGDRITTPRRLTVSEGQNYPSAWTPDSRSVIFESDRNGQWGIFRQSLDEDTAEPIVAGLEDAVFPSLSPDGAWILYSVFPNNGDSSTPVRLVRVARAGGPAQLVMTTAAMRQRAAATTTLGAPTLALRAPTYGSPRCARSPSTVCAIAELAPDRKDLIFTAFDPVKGRGRELTRLTLDPAIHYTWSLAPDGSSIAVLEGSEGRIRILSLTGQPPQEIVVKAWDGIQTLDWAADGRGLYLCSYTQNSSVLLRVDFEGNARALWQQKGSHHAIWVAPSSDGRHVAMSGRSGNHNVWMIENF